MKSIENVESCYDAIADELQAFVNSRPWDLAVGTYRLFSNSTSAEWYLVHAEKQEHSGGFPPREIASRATEALFFLRDDLLRTTGDRIWGLTFTLFPTGKFKVEYDYNKPESYEETDETISLGDALGSLQNILAGGNKPKE
jgi:hypothetical protein